MSLIRMSPTRRPRPIAVLLIRTGPRAQYIRYEESLPSRESTALAGTSVSFSFRPFHVTRDPETPTEKASEMSCVLAE